MPALPDVIVFDVDGVLVEVTASYRETVRATVKYFTGDDISHELIQDFKNQGGWNNDWDLVHRLVTDRRVVVTYDEVVAKFNEIFLGKNGDGLIRYEQWIPEAGFFDNFQNRSKLGIFTGRVRYELDPTMKRFAPDVRFDAIVTADDVTNQKPAPDGLQLIQKQFPSSTLWYLGDTVDDAISAKAAGVPFLGVAARSNPRYSELVGLLEEHGAFAVINDVNEIHGLMQKRQTESA